MGLRKEPRNESGQFLESLRKIDVNDLDLNNIGSWPAAVKVIVCVLLTAAVLALGYNFHLRDLQTQLEQQAAQEESLKQQFATKAFQAANLEAYKAQMKEMEESFGALLRQLPSDTEVPGLLEDITRTGLGSGLEFEEIKLLLKSLSSSISSCRSRSAWSAATTTWRPSSAACPACRGSLPCMTSRSSRLRPITPRSCA